MFVICESGFSIEVIAKRHTK